MEDGSGAVIMSASPDNDNNNKSVQVAANHVQPKKKNRRAMNLLRIALYMLRRKSGVKPTNNVGLWRKILGSVRPLHLQSSDQSPPPPPLPSETTPPLNVVVEHIVEEAMTPPLSPAIPSSSSSVDGGMSQYASAVSLQELDRCQEEDEDEDEDEEEEVYADGLGDVMIDAKAEEFIAHFYEQMRLQNMKHTNGTTWSLR